MAGKDDTIKLLMEIHKTVNATDKNVAVQGTEIKNLSSTVGEMKDEQTRQNTVVQEHEQRSTASEGRMTVIEDKHEIFTEEHKQFKERIKVAEKPSLILKNIWRALITLGTGAAAMYGILRLLGELRP